MSWLNTTSIANLAKTAFKEAQKTIDKALDIRDNDAVDKPIENEIIGHFFESFNLVKEENDPPDETRTNAHGVVVSEPASDIAIFEVPASVPQTTVKDLNSLTEMLTVMSTEDAEKIYPNVLNHVVIANFLEETNVNESYHSSMSVSSSITVISPENDLADMDWKSDTKSDTREETFNHHGTQIKEEVSTMLSEAMKDSIKTETSASASGDEIETTTSSDIEIIASPQAGIRQLLPAIQSRSNELKTRSRKPSDASSEDSATSTGHGLDPHKTECKIIQLNQMIEARDNQLLEYTRKCYTLSEEVERVKLQLTHEEKERTALGETIRRQSDEFAIRLSSIEKRYQQVLAERELLVKKLDQIQQNQESYSSLTEHIREKNETIEQLRFEGEKLSKQHLQLSNIIKKLRVQEKEEEVRCKQLKDENEELKSEIDRVNKCLSAKEELERNQIETVRQTVMVNSQLEREVMANKLIMRDKLAEVVSLRATLTEVEQKLKEERASSAIRDSEETERSLSAEVSLRQRLQLEYETSSRLFEEERHALAMRCQELTHSFADVDSDRSRERERIQFEVSRLMQRLHEAESRNDELSQALTIATKPLIRQIETMQQTLISQRLSTERSETTYIENIAVLESKLLSLSKKEVADKELHLAMQVQVNEALEKCKIATQENHSLLIQLEQEKCRSLNLEEARKKDNLSLELVKSQLIEEVTLLRSKIEILESNQHEKQSNALAEEERKKTTNFTNRSQDKELEFQVFPTIPDLSISGSIGRKITSTTDIVSRTSSPTPSLGKLSLSGSFNESHSSNPWTTTDEVFDGGLVTPVPKSTLYDTMRAGSYTAVFESLQAQLKTRDGEVTQLQQELENQKRSRDSLAKELTEMINSNQKLSDRLTRLETLLQEYENLDTKYNALLQMYGEKIEENEELRLDLVDVKEMYKAQIDHLMKT